MFIAAIAFISIAIIIYAIQILRYGLVRLRPFENDAEERKTPAFITLIVPFRNEKNNLPALLDDLRQQELESNLYEVIFVDDHSDDGSADLLKGLLQGIDNYSLIALDAVGGKKHAIDAGVLRARGTWILQIDADCRIGSRLIPEYSANAARDELCFVAGPVSYLDGGRLWDRIETLEFLSLSGSGLFAFQTGRPVMCNGANMAYAKDFYMEVRARLLEIDSPSGDDIFLLTEAKKHEKELMFLYSKEAIVYTYPSGSVKDFLTQRIRWGSKSKVYTDKDIIWLAIVVYLASFALTALFVMTCIMPQIWMWFVGLWLLKFVPDLILMRRTLGFFDRKGLLWLFPLTALFYYFYIAITGPVSLLSGFRWKGRSFRADGIDQ